jgi:hypothetical protein
MALTMNDFYKKYKYILWLITHFSMAYLFVNLGMIELNEVMAHEKSDLSSYGYLIMYIREIFTFPLSVLGESVDLNSIHYVVLIFINSAVVILVLFFANFMERKNAN